MACRQGDIEARIRVCVPCNVHVLTMADGYDFSPARSDRDRCGEGPSAVRAVAHGHCPFRIQKGDVHIAIVESDLRQTCRGGTEIRRSSPASLCAMVMARAEHDVMRAASTGHQPSGVDLMEDGPQTKIRGGMRA